MPGGGVAPGLAAVTRQETAKGAPPDGDRGVPPTWQVREAALEAASLVHVDLGLPSGAYSRVTRTVTAVTTGLHPAGEEPLMQVRYELADGREVALARMPGSDALRDLSPLAYTTAIVQIRAASGRLMAGRTTGGPIVLAWTEGGRSYQLSSMALTAGELIALAEQLR